MNGKPRSVEASKIDKEQLRTDLRRIGIAENDHVAVALSFKSIGSVKGGPNTLIDALLEVVGPAGTIMVNTHTKFFPISAVDKNYIFDPEFTPPLTGTVPTLFLKRKQSIRSPHPTCSVAAMGRYAQFLTAGHDERSAPYLPLIKLAVVGGKFLGIGLDNRIVALRHEAQRRAGLFAVPMLSGVLYKAPTGKTKLFTWVNPPCARKLPELTPKLERMGVIRSDKIGKANSIIGQVNEILDSMTTLLRDDPTLNLCDNISCVSCRELERRMNLYGRIRNPKLFQKSLLLRQLLAIRNLLIIRIFYSQTSFNDSSHKKLTSTIIATHDAIKKGLQPVLELIYCWSSKP